MTLRTFLIKATAANLLFAWIPVIGCAVVATVRHNPFVWDVLDFFPTFWRPSLLLLAVTTFVLSAVSLYRRDFIVAMFAAAGSFLVFSAFWVAGSHVNFY
jgi:hypothetical protein